MIEHDGMNTNEFIRLVTESLQAIEKQYRRPYEKRRYERILCYEFYHQLRTRMYEAKSSFVLHGELDKRYLNIKRIPDFIFHIPGTNTNLAVIEFKSARSGIRWIKEDLRKLREFMEKPLKYAIGILVIFGEVNELERIREQLSGIPSDPELLKIFFDIQTGNLCCTDSYERF